jgi:outer membrane receptor for ferrienterochelin and colicins
MKFILLTIGVCLFGMEALAQGNILKGRLMSNNKPAEFLSVLVKGTYIGTTADANGEFILRKVPAGKHILVVNGVGYETKNEEITVSNSTENNIIIQLKESVNTLNEVVVTGTMKEVVRSESVVSMEIINPTFFRKNPTPNMFETMNLVNGVRPQINCNVCNTGDIHINGMEGGYTMIMIDGMPIVSALSTVYGLMGIPNSMIERIEIVKGPSSTLYGSEAVGGIINVITKNPVSAPLLVTDFNASTYGEYNLDLSAKVRVAKAVGILSGNYFNFQNRFDLNNDNFTDVTLQNRISIFNKWNFSRAKERVFSLAARYVNENRYGGELQWNPDKDRGSSTIYGESILTNRLELLSTYQLPINDQKVNFQFSYNYHNQDSFYGNTPYLAVQHVGFGQLVWDKKLSKNHDALLGVAMRYTHYDDNSAITRESTDTTRNKPTQILLPGVFVQDEISIGSKSKLLLGIRYDHNQEHGSIWSPRLNWKFSPSLNDVIRLSVGNGYRVVNLFSEDHAAYTGARKVIIAEKLLPERSWNINFNYRKTVTLANGFVGFDASVFYTYFSNKIVADYDTDPKSVIFANQRGYGEQKGASGNLDFTFGNGLKLMAGFTYVDVYRIENEEKIWQVQTPRLTSTFTVSYSKPGSSWSFDVSGNTASSMRLPLINKDFRNELSPSYQNVNCQITKRFKNGLDMYLGVKNVFNYLPDVKLVYRAADLASSLQTSESFSVSPNGYYFNPDYNYAPMQGIRAFVGLRLVLR